ncbi:MAG TPA: outer membrane lipoprotein chaperone LolA [Vicinamibacterales bacterium]
MSRSLFALLPVLLGGSVLMAAAPIAPVARPAAAATQATGGSSDEAAARDLAARLQGRYDAIRDFTADFTHTYEGGVLRRKTTESGTVAVKKPGRMRWEYKRPEEKLFVSDGRKIYAWIPADRQVTVSSLPAEGQPATPALFLMGRGNLLRDFTVSMAPPVPGAPEGSAGLTLVPRTKVPDYEQLTMVVDAKSLTLRMLIARDAQGGTSTFTFTNLRENVGLPDSRFSFTIPRGADVVTQS